MEKKTKRGLDPAIIKGLTIFLLVALLLIPLGIITKTIDERRYRSQDTESTLLQEFGGEQVINGPLVIIPYEDYIYNNKKELIRVDRHKAYFLPDTLELETVLSPEIRNRGIYEFLLYKGRVDVKGVTTIDFNKIKGDIDNILWDDAYLELEISDMKGLTGKPDFIINKKSAQFESELSRTGVFTGGISTPLNLENSPRKVDFKGNFSIQGGRSISFIPVGDENRVSIRSTWDNPSFFGAFLPNDKTIDDNGFNSSYQIMSYSRDYKSQMTNSEFDDAQFYSSYFGVKLLFPVDMYLLTQRSVKYGLLFIVLPFLVFFLFEIFSRIKVHPFHYLFVGITSSLFFLLLVAISEQFSFKLGYVLGAIAVSGLITYYSCYFLKSIKRGLIIFPLMAVSYFFMYLMINSQDYALLIGSIGIFTIVGGVMITTRNVDWYSLGDKNV